MSKYLAVASLEGRLQRSEAARAAGAEQLADV